MTQQPRPSHDGCADDARDLFRRHGIRCTQQRTMIYDALRAACCHPTADDLFRIVRERDPGLSLATVYNTLDVLSDAGLVNRLPPASPSGPSRYDADQGEHIHAMLADGSIMDVPDDLSSRLTAALPADVLAEIQARLGVQIDRVHIQLAASRIG